MLANNLIKEYRQTQWKEFLKRQGNNPLSSAPFWKRVNRLRACKRKRRIEALILNNIKVTKNTEKAELFAENLENKFKQDMSNLKMTFTLKSTNLLIRSQLRISFHRINE